MAKTHTDPDDLLRDALAESRRRMISAKRDLLGDLHRMRDVSTIIRHHPMGMLAAGAAAGYAGTSLICSMIWRKAPGRPGGPGVAHRVIDFGKRFVLPLLTSLPSVAASAAAPAAATTAPSPASPPIL